MIVNYHDCNGTFWLLSTDLVLYLTQELSFISNISDPYPFTFIIYWKARGSGNGISTLPRSRTFIKSKRISFRFRKHVRIVCTPHSSMSSACHTQSLPVKKKCMHPWSHKTWRTQTTRAKNITLFLCARLDSHLPTGIWTLLFWSNRQNNNKNVTIASAMSIVPRELHKEFIHPPPGTTR